MEFEYTYAADSHVESSASRTAMSLSPDTLREPTFFRGDLRQAIEFREAISALHDVVISDLRWHPKDRTEYKAWLAQQEEIEWAMLASQREETARQVEQVRAELDQLRRTSQQRMAPYYKAQREYFNFLYQRNRQWWIVLDPVITVHPDEVFFECFSRDESSYGRLSASFDVFENIGEFACGTTNIDYSTPLYNEFQKIRTYKTTTFEIDRSGFEVQTTAEASFKEVKIDLPDSWVRGFLQVSSAMALPMVSFDLHPMDLHNLCFVLRRNKELVGPRAMRYVLQPGAPVKVIFEPWNLTVECPRSRYQGDFTGDIRVWGRRRIHILERLIPIANKFTVHLLGMGMPSFYVADLGDLSFTLGLSGWTSNNWSETGNFDLPAPRAEVDSLTKQRVFDALKQTWRDTPDALASRLNLDRRVVLGALAAYTQAGRAIWDLQKNVYRARELSREPLPLERLRFSNEREDAAMQMVSAGGVEVGPARMDERKVTSLSGQVKENKGTFSPELQVDGDERILNAKCTCNWHQQNRLRKGPCEHILALRMQHRRQSLPHGFQLN
mgnify:FL=1